MLFVKECQAFFPPGGLTVPLISGCWSISFAAGVVGMCYLRQYRTTDHLGWRPLVMKPVVLLNVQQLKLIKIDSHTLVDSGSMDQHVIIIQSETVYEKQSKLSRQGNW